MQRAASSVRRSLGILQLTLKGALQEPWGKAAYIGPSPDPAMTGGSCTRLPLIKKLNSRIKLGAGHYYCNYSTRASDFKLRHSAQNGIMQNQAGRQHGSKQDNRAVDQNIRGDTELVFKKTIGKNISSVDKRKFLINTLFDLKDSKEAVYGTLDAWVAWEQNFPLATLKNALIVLEKEQQWHRVVQVLKWMLSKGQGTTMGTYEQLIRALEKDNRAEEAHKIWVKKVSHDLHSVPWRVCDLVISIYYRNNMLERLVKLFKGLESYDRRPPTKSIVQKVADAYEMLGLLEEKGRVMQKYGELFSDSADRHSKKFRKNSRKNEKKSGKKRHNIVEASDTGSAGSSPSNEEIEVNAQIAAYCEVEGSKQAQTEMHPEAKCFNCLVIL